MTARAYLRSHRGVLLTFAAVAVAALLVALTGDRRAALLSLADDGALVAVIFARRIARLVGGLR